MLKPIKFDKRTRKKQSKGFRQNISVHPFVLVALLAAIAVVVWAIIFLAVRIILPGSH